WNILGEIGDWWYGVLAADVADFLWAAGGADVTVNINSPGGDMFEGIAIYNLLRQYTGKVHINVIGLAASAASLIAMAGDTVQMSSASFLMIHNCWLVAVGNRHDFAQTATQMQAFDDAMCGLYHARTGLAREEIAVMMDNESYINGDRALALGFCDALFDADTLPTAPPAPDAAAAHRVDVLMAKQGVPRSERRKLLKELKGTHNAARDVTPRADNALLDELKQWQASLSA
ncbi:head maturation protease, ClpP-related, partial [Conchiformibius steedae]|uniref:head maturation protease, ClpP-related n=1 Tax=Conchiformibius steedae TaxID=153493 RepID=UPI0026EA3030